MAGAIEKRCDQHTQHNNNLYQSFFGQNFCWHRELSFHYVSKCNLLLEL